MAPRKTFSPARRAFLASSAAGISFAALGCGGSQAESMAAAPAVPAGFAPPTDPLAPLLAAPPYTLPDLGYDFDALEPHIDAATMEIHWSRHHQAYVNGLNAAIDDTPSLADTPLETLLTDLDSVPEDARTAIRNHGGGHYNHTLFWQTIGPDGGGQPTGALATSIDRHFGSLDNFTSEFRQAGASVFGSGWAWLCQRPDGTLALHTTPNQDTPLADGLHPLLGVDVWEHAYYLHYQNERARYLEHFLEVIRWDAVAERLR